MSRKGRTDKELWTALACSDDDLLDPDMPESLVNQELLGVGIDPQALAERAIQFVVQAKEDERLSWQAEAQRTRERLKSLVAESNSRLRHDMTRAEILTRLDELRRADENIGSAIRMAARKRKPEESSDSELRALLDEMEALRAIERGGRS